MVRFENVTKYYEEGGPPAIRDFSLAAEPGEFLLLTGRSGAGKTTVLRLILKEIEPSAGRIFVDGEELAGIPVRQLPYYRRKIGVIFQDFRLVQERTVYENLSLARLALGWDARDTEKRIRNVLSFLSIDRLHRRYPKELSGGEQQKVCLARAILNNPRLILADEPTGNLDPAASRDLLTLLKLLRNQGRTIILASHDAEVIRDCGEDVRRIALPDSRQS